MTKRKNVVRVGALNFALMTRELLAGATVAEIHQITGLHRVTICHYIQALRKAKAVHVHAWEQDTMGRWMVRSYMIGNKPDAPRVPPKTDKQVKADYKKRKASAVALGLVKQSEVKELNSMGLIAAMLGGM